MQVFSVWRAESVPFISASLSFILVYQLDGSKSVEGAPRVFKRSENPLLVPGRRCAPLETESCRFNLWPLWARDYDHRLGRNLATDFTLPIIALSAGRKFRKALQDMFGKNAIEDFGLSYFCTSCTLSTGEIVVHEICSKPCAMV